MFFFQTLTFLWPNTVLLEMLEMNVNSQRIQAFNLVLLLYFARNFEALSLFLFSTCEFLLILKVIKCIFK